MQEKLQLYNTTKKSNLFDSAGVRFINILVELWNTIKWNRLANDNRPFQLHRQQQQTWCI